jgi:hypothetical protein
VTVGNEAYELNLKTQDYKCDSYTKNLVGRLFGRCLRNHLGPCLTQMCINVFSVLMLSCASGGLYGSYENRLKYFQFTLRCIIISEANSELEQVRP